MSNCFLRFLGTVLFSCCDHDNEINRWQPSRSETHENISYYSKSNDNDNESDRFQPSRKANQSSYQFYQYDNESFKSNILANLRLEIPNSYSSSSDNITNTNSCASHGSSVRSNSSPHYQPENTVSPPYTVRSASLSNNLVGKPKANEFKSSPLPKIESNTAASSHPTKSIQPSTFYRPNAVALPSTYTNKPANSSSIQWVVKSIESQNSITPKPIPVVSPTPKYASPSIYSTKHTYTPHFVQSDAGLSSFKTSDSSKAGPSQREFRVSKSHASGNSSSPPKGGPGPNNNRSPNNNKDPKKFGKGSTERYEIPEHIKEMIKKDIVPPVLKMPLSPHTYADYFAALLYAEDFYCEKWSAYLLDDVTLKLRIKEYRSLQDRSNKKKNKKDSNSKTGKKDYPYVTFEIENVPERRPYLLSRDHVHLKPSDESEDEEPFNGVLVRVEKGTTILAEFNEDFHRQHEPSKKYDVSFSFNRVCLKRAHRAISAAVNPLLCQILFPKPTSSSEWSKPFLVDRILNHKFAPLPYLIEGPFIKNNNQLPNWMMTHIKNIVRRIYESSNKSRVLICAPTNRACDELMMGIMNDVNQVHLFRANAAFREKEDVPDDVMTTCLFRGECFTCPQLYELENFRIITSTFVSTFRLYNAGLKAGHFSHIILVDASSTIEPEVMVALADLLSEETIVVVTGCADRVPYWVRSEIARRHGLKKSFFERLLEREPYQSGNPLFITHIREERKSNVPLS